MRCSICLAELKETPQGLRCDACDTLLEPMVDEDADRLEPASRFGQRTWMSIAAGAAVTIAVFFVGIYYLAPGEQIASRESSEPELVTKLAQQSGFVRTDENGIVMDALQVSDLGQAKTLIAEKGCQHLSGEPVEAIQWVNISGSPLQNSRPDLPGNWNLDFACATQDRGAILATLLQDGIAISRIDATGDLAWTHLKTSSGLFPETVSIMTLDQTLYVVSQEESSGRVRIASIDQRGDENWTLSVEASGAITRPRIVQNSFGEILFAWKEGVNAVRLVTLSTSVIAVQDTLLPDRALPIKAVSDDDIGRTLVLQGGAESVAELISPSGALEWRWQSASPATPLGVLRDEQNFLVFAASGRHLLVWKLDASGNASERLDIVLAEEISSGGVKPLNAVEAVAMLELMSGRPVDLVLDLRRVSNALTIEPGERPSTVLAAADIAVEETAPTAAEPATFAETPANEGLDPAPSDVTTEPLELEPVPQPATPPVEAVSDPLPQQEEVTSASEVNTTEVIGAIPVLEAETDPSIARCTFTCISLDAAPAEYTLMQSVEVNEGETLTDVSLRLSDTHESLCSISGGEPTPAYDRQCRR